MRRQATRYKRHRFPPEIIQHAVWLYYRFNQSHRDIEDLLAQRGIVVTHESIRLWCNKFGPRYALRLRRANNQAELYRRLRQGAFSSWDGAVAVSVAT